MLQKAFKNDDLGIELKSFIDKQQNVWFKGKDVAVILGYRDTDQAIRKNVSTENKITQFIQPKCSPVSKTGKQNDTKVKCPWNKMIMISNEKELHYKVVNLIRNYYPDSLLVAGLGENQDTEEKRLDSYKKGYSRGQPDLMVLNYHKDYQGLCIEFKSPTNYYEVSESQLKMKEKYIKNNYAFILSNDYDKISKLIHKYMYGVRIPCEYCSKRFRKIKTLNNHYRVIHRIKI